MPMDQETERRLANLIMEEAAMLRRRADKEGVHVYLAKPTVRVRPNPQFLRATMQSVEQSNRIVEVNEMWRRRNAELEVDGKKRSSRSERDDRHDRRGRERGSRRRDVHTDRGNDSNGREQSTSDFEEQHTEREAGLRDDEVERFLQSRVKRGRGAVGSRMDETGPYPSIELPVAEAQPRKEEASRLIGPQFPSKLKRKLTEDKDDVPTLSKLKKHKKEHSSKKKKRKDRS